MRAADGRPTVLVTEDEALISLDLCDALHQAGYVVIGPSDTLHTALRLLDGEQPDVVIVDLLLRDGSCAPLVDQLHRRGLPFLIHSGYSRRDELAGPKCQAPWVVKPAKPSDVVAQLGVLLRQAVPA